MRSSPLRFASAPASILFSSIRQKHCLRAIDEPTFFAWKNENVRAHIVNYILTENFKTRPAYGREFIDEIKSRIRTTRSEAELYEKLKRYFDSAHCRKVIFSHERANRLSTRVRQIRELLGTNTVGSLLDVGCGNGEIAHELMQSLGLSYDNVQGLEVVLPNKAKINIVKFNGFDFPAFAKPFDLVTAFSVLHHAEDPIQLIKEIKKALANGGHLIIRDCDASTDDLKSFNLIADYLWYKIYTLDDNVPITGNYLSANEWTQLFQSEGFKVDKITHPEPENPYNPFMMMLSFPM